MKIEKYEELYFQVYTVMLALNTTASAVMMFSRFKMSRIKESWIDIFTSGQADMFDECTRNKFCTSEVYYNIWHDVQYFSSVAFWSLWVLLCATSCIFLFYREANKII